MSGPKRNADKLNVIGVVVIGVCGAVLVYVTIVALQAFYMGDTADIQMMADYGGQDTQQKSLRAQQQASLQAPAQPNPAAPGMTQTYRIKIDDAMRKILDEGKRDTQNLIPVVGSSSKATVLPVFGRPQSLTTAPAPQPAPPAPAPPNPTPETDPAPAPAPQPPAGGNAP